jgi:hypothetical protein
MPARADQSQSITEAEFTQGVSTYAQAVDRGDADLTMMGFPQAERPKSNGELADRPELPERISDLTMTQLIDLLNWYTAWFDYATNLMPKARSEKTSLETARDFAWAKIRREKTLERTVSDKDDATRTDLRYIQLNARLETADYKYNMLKAISEGLYRDIETISRAITCLEHKYNAEGHRFTGERVANRNNASQSHPGRADVLARFRRRPGT